LSRQTIRAIVEITTGGRMSEHQHHPETHPLRTAPTGPQPAGSFAITSLVTGIVAFILGWTPLGFVLGIIALVFGILGLRKKQNKGMSIAGIVTGGMGLLASLAIIAMAVLGIALSSLSYQQSRERIEQQQERQQSMLDAKKEFAKGETALFGDIEITATDVNRQYTPTEDRYVEQGLEYVVVTVSVKNVGETSNYVSNYDFRLVADGESYTANYIQVPNEFDGTTLQPGDTREGAIIFAIPEGSESLSLEYTTYALGEELTYRLAL